jgi:hypothetical protein
MRQSIQAIAALALWAAALPAAQAGVEFVTRTGDCTKVDTVGDGKDLSLIAGPNVRFRVFGNSVDLSNPTSGFRIATDSGSGSVSARIVSQGRDCGGVGFALVEVDSADDLSSDIQRSLFFKMPLGDESRLQMRIRAFPTINATWAADTSVSCIGIAERLNQDKTLRISLPAGYLNDPTNCASRTLRVRVANADFGEIDIRPSFNYAVSGLPAFLSVNQPSPTTLAVDTTILNLVIDVARIRALTTASNSTLTVTSRNPNRTSTLALNVALPPAQGFAQAAVCRNPTTGNTVIVDDLVNCELRLANPPPAAGQLVTFEMRDKSCLSAGTTSSNMTYSAVTGIGTILLTGTSTTIFQVPLRTRGGTSSAGTPCASLTGVQHTGLFWVGARDSESGPDFTTATFRIRTLQ